MNRTESTSMATESAAQVFRRITQLGMRMRWRAGTSLMAMLLSGSVTAAEPLVALPKVFVRSTDAATSVICASKEPGAIQTWIISPYVRAWRQGLKLNVQVLEFFSGARHSAKLQLKADGQAVLQLPSGKHEVDCVPNAVPDASLPVKSDGSYLDILNVNAWGETGTDIAIERDDIGTQGLALRDKSGSLQWAVLLAVRDRATRGHPTYNIPGWYRILDHQYSSARVLPDNSLLLVYPRLWAFRISLANGQLLTRHPDIRSMPLEDWAAAKAKARAEIEPTACAGRSGDCTPAASPIHYFISLRDYLFR